jgi:hypothetical protein
MNWDRQFWDLGGNREDNLYSNVMHPGFETIIAAPLTSKYKNNNKIKYSPEIW